MLGDVKNDGVPLGTRTKRLRIVDYYTVPWDDVRAGTPAAVMIASRELVTGTEKVFAWHLVAEREGIPPEQIPSRHPPTPPSKQDGPWIACARAVLANSLTVPPEGSSRPRDGEGRGGAAAHPAQAGFASSDGTLPATLSPAGPLTPRTEATPDLVLFATVPPGGGVRGTSDSSGAPRQADDSFIPSDLQRQILQKLDGKALTLDALVSKLHVDRSRLHRDGLKELMARGLVKNSRRVGGYYRPDAPPPELRDLLAPG
jgi:hypothetical protein